MNSDSLRDRAELQWRVSIMFDTRSLFIAVPLSRVTKEGRYGRLIQRLSCMLLIFYCSLRVMLCPMVIWIQQNFASPYVFIMIGGALYYFPNFETPICKDIIVILLDKYIRILYKLRCWS